MLVLVSAVLLLIGAPVVLLVVGRAIVRATDFEARRAARRVASGESGEAWYYRAMRPAFRWEE